MRHNVNTSQVRIVVPLMEDGVVNSLPVDSFPVDDKSHYKDDGWPMSDIGILDRFTRDHVDKEQLEKIALRLEAIKAEPRNNKSDAEILKSIRPAYVQTAAEMADYESWVYNYLESKDDRPQDIVKTDTTTTTEVSEPAN